MLFTVSKILWSLLQPTKAWLLLVALGVLLLYVDRFRLGRFLLSVAVVLAFLTVILPIHTWLASPLEQRFSRLKTFPKTIDGIIVLGGGVDELLTSFYEQPTLNYAAERMTEAVSLARHYPQAKLVFSGGSAIVNQASLKMTEADVAERLFVSLGIDKSRIVLESASRNTYENAVNTQALVQPKPNQVWLLVTSAMHMPRSVGIFRNIGWPVTPYPSDYRVIAGQRQPNLGFAEKLMIIDGASKEWVGLVSYYFLGRTSELFPK